MERGNPAKLAHKLTDKVLHPSCLEKVNVKLATAATHESTSTALRHFAQHQPNFANFKDTAEFLELVRRWFNICNVKSPHMASRLNDDNRVPLRSNCQKSAKSLQFLVDFGTFMRNWVQSDCPVTAKLSKDTGMAVYYTCRGLHGLTNYLLEHYPDVIQYVLLGKVQSDATEGHFGHLRKLAGSNYWASVRQFMEGETVIRVSSLIWWSGVKVSELPARMALSQKARAQGDSAAVLKLREAVEESEDAEQDQPSDSEKAALGHIAGYLARSATKNGQCKECADVLVSREHSSIPIQVNDEDQEDSIVQSFTKILDRGRLIVPSSLAIHSKLISTNVC